jgi:hypothetical protein
MFRLELHPLSFAILVLLWLQHFPGFTLVLQRIQKLKGIVMSCSRVQIWIEIKFVVQNLFWAFRLEPDEEHQSDSCVCPPLDLTLPVDPLKLDMVRAINIVVLLLYVRNFNICTQEILHIDFLFR